VIGRTLSSYRVVSKLGAGGMGEVYRARDEKLDRDVAVKFLPPGLLGDETARSRFRKEAKALSRLTHPHVATLLDFGSADGIDYLVMELVPGLTLGEALRKGPLPVKEAVRLGTQLARGLMAAHEQGIVHRDLKPSNLCLTADGLLKILDFGLARLVPATSQDSAGETPTETAAGKVVGSPPYMSPEQLLGKDVDARSDVYSAGACLYELMTGRRPYGERSGAALTDAILHEAPEMVSRVNGEVPAGLTAVIAKAMDKDPGLRYQTAAELLVDLERLQQGSEARSTALGSAGPRSPEHHSGRRWAVVAGAAAAVAAGTWLLRPPPTPRITNVTPLHLDLGWLSESGLVSTWATDGVRLYYVARRQDEYRLFQVPVAGGEPSEVEIPEGFRGGFEIHGFLPKQSALLCLVDPPQAMGGATGWPAWMVPVPKGTPRALAGLAARTAAVSPDGERIVLAQPHERRLLIANADGSDARTLFELPGRPFFVTWAPNGKTIRFSAMGPSGHGGESWIWETTLGGDPPRALFPGRRGDWTRDGRHFAFERRNERASRFDLFVVREGQRLPWTSTDPVPLTNGPVSFFATGPSPDGQGWLAFGTDRRGELLRFDQRLGRFGKLLGGQSIGFVDASPDGEWLAWVSYPEEVLWQGRRDGSESYPLTSAPLRAWMPRWSPDGKQILFVGMAPGEPGRAVRLVPAGGGAIETLAAPERDRDLWDPCWLPDGHSVVFGRLQADPTALLGKLDLRTRVVSMLPGSKGLQWPKCGPMGQILTVRAPDPSTVVWWPERGAWEVVGPARGAYPTWTHDGRSFCELSFAETAIECYSFATRRYETLTQLGEMRLLPWVGVPWMGLDLDGSPMVMRDVSTSDLYALDWEAP